MSDPIKPIKEQLVDLFNDALAQSGISTEYEEEDLTFSDPIAYDPGTVDPSEPEAHNTRLTVTAGSGLEQIVYQLHYTRLDLSRLVEVRDPEIEGTGDESSTFDLLELISEHIDFVLSEDDVEDELLDEEGDVTTVLIKAKADSLAVTGESSLIVTAPATPQGGP